MEQTPDLNRVRKRVYPPASAELVTFNAGSNGICRTANGRWQDLMPTEGFWDGPSEQFVTRCGFDRGPVWLCFTVAEQRPATVTGACVCLWGERESPPCLLPGRRACRPCASPTGRRRGNLSALRDTGVATAQRSGTAPPPGPTTTQSHPHRPESCHLSLSTAQSQLSHLLITYLQTTVPTS